MRFFVSKILMLFLVLLMLVQPVQAKAVENSFDESLVCRNATQKFEKKYQIKKHLLTTISSVETGRWNNTQQQSLAWPWTINAQGKGRFFNTKAEAVKEVKKLQKQGVKSIDVGCMQINLAYHPDAFESIEDAFDPETNVEYSAKFLTSLYENKNSDWIKAAMAYHSSVPEKALKYKKKIVSAYELVKQAQNDIDTKLQKIVSVKTQKTAKKNVNIAQKSVNKDSKRVVNANQWREAKLAEYRRNKNR